MVNLVTLYLLSKKGCSAFRRFSSSFWVRELLFENVILMDWKISNELSVCIILKIFLCRLWRENKFLKQLSGNDLVYRELLKNAKKYSFFFLVFTHKSWLTDQFYEWKIWEQHVIVHYSWAKFERRTFSNITGNNYKPNQVWEHCNHNHWHFSPTDWTHATSIIVNVWFLSVRIYPNLNKSSWVNNRVELDSILWR